MNCSNNLLDGPKLSRYTCLRKGIGVGLNLPFRSPSPFQPVNPDKLYCGAGSVVPVGYTRMGYSHECLQKGVGIGRMLKSLYYYPIITVYTLYVIINILVFLIWIELYDPDVYTILGIFGLMVASIIGWYMLNSIVRMILMRRYR
jgi:hypothetical protein